MKTCIAHFSAAVLAISSASPVMSGTIEAAFVERTAPDRLSIRWASRAPVDVLQTDKADSGPDDAMIVSAKDRDGVHALTVTSGARPFFLLRDTRSKDVVRVAERVLPLQQGSNLRDVGGYAAAGGKHVRWGLIYRSGGQPMLTGADVRGIKDLGIASLVDLRSSEERAMSQTRLDGIPYTAIGYSIDSLMAPLKAGAQLDTGALNSDGHAGGYRTMPTLLAPHLRIIFKNLLSETRPILYNCSAGQDRTGFVTAMILSALGVGRETVYADYLLSTPSRRPEWEFMQVDDVLAKTSPFAAMIAKSQKQPEFLKANSLEMPDGRPYLTVAFAEIDRHWGAVETYLQQEIGLDQVKIAQLRARYLE